MTASDRDVARTASTVAYAKLDAARKVGLDAGETWIIMAIRRGYAPRASFSYDSSSPLERISAGFEDGSAVEPVIFPGDIEVAVDVLDLDYPTELFGAKGSNIPLMPVTYAGDEIGRYYLIRSRANDQRGRSLKAEELFVVSLDIFGNITDVRKIFYRSW